MTAGRCAFTGCQAGGDILDRAPRVLGYLRWPEHPVEFHPGCLAAALLVGSLVFDRRRRSGVGRPDQPGEVEGP